MTDWLALIVQAIVVAYAAGIAFVVVALFIKRAREN